MRPFEIGENTSPAIRYHRIKWKWYQVGYASNSENIEGFFSSWWCWTNYGRQEILVVVNEAEQQRYITLSCHMLIQQRIRCLLLLHFVACGLLWLNYFILELQDWNGLSRTKATPPCRRTVLCSPAWIWNPLILYSKWLYIANHGNDIADDVILIFATIEPLRGLNTRDVFFFSSWVGFRGNGETTSGV